MLLLTLVKSLTVPQNLDLMRGVGGVAFPCHRALLASSSEYFWALFGETTAERLAGTVSLPAITPEGLDAILDFLYSGWLSVSPSTLPVVLEAARYLQVETAVSICERFITDGLCAENCCCYANLAERHALPDALEAANQTIALEMMVLLQENRDDLLGLNIQSLMEVLDADEIPGVKEVELANLALDWLDENGPLPLLKSNFLLSRLRFGLVAVSDLNNLSNDDRREATKEVLHWDLKGRSWEKRAPMSIARFGHRLATVNNYIYALLGMYEPFCDIERYDSQADHWTRLRPLVTGSFGYGMASMPSGILLVFGGRRWSDGQEVIVKSVLEYDTKKDRWREICQLPSGHIVRNILTNDGVKYLKRENSAKVGLFSTLFLSNDTRKVILSAGPLNANEPFHNPPPPGCWLCCSVPFNQRLNIQVISLKFGHTFSF
uniref:Kelch like family member 34 n=1 Tax=Sphaeramia orbicularis TaxID=375764 RepID=A0A672YR80_9TELE